MKFPSSDIDVVSGDLEVADNQCNDCQGIYDVLFDGY